MRILRARRILLYAAFFAVSTAGIFGIAMGAIYTLTSDVRASIPGTYSIGVVPGEWTAVSYLQFTQDSRVGYQTNMEEALFGRFVIGVGGLFVHSTSSGIIYRAPNGSCWRKTVTNGGVAMTTSITCP